MSVWAGLITEVEKELGSVFFEFHKVMEGNLKKLYVYSPREKGIRQKERK